MLNAARQRLQRGFSIFREDLGQRHDHGHAHVLEEEEREDGQHRADGLAYKDSVDIESTDTYLEHEREEGGGLNAMDAATYLKRKKRLRSSKGMYVSSTVFLFPRFWPV